VGKPAAKEQKKGEWAEGRKEESTPPRSGESTPFRPENITCVAKRQKKTPAHLPKPSPKTGGKKELQRKCFFVSPRKLRASMPQIVGQKPEKV